MKKVLLFAVAALTLASCETAKPLPVVTQFSRVLKGDTIILTKTFSLPRARHNMPRRDSVEILRFRKGVLISFYRTAPQF